MSNEPKKARPIGRPTKYKREYCQQLIDYSKTGMSFESFALEIDIVPDTLHEWAKVHKEFSDAKKKAKALQERALMTIGLKGLKGDIKGFRDATWIFWMKARFGWKDHSDGSDNKDDELEFVG